MTTTSPATTAAKSARLALFVGGLAAIGFGIAILVWPTKTAVAIAGVIAVYAIVAGIVYIAMGIASKTLGTGGRVGHVLLGVLYVLAGVFAFGSLQQSAAFLALFITVMVGVMWIIEGFTALFALGGAGSKVVTIIFAVLSIFAGVTLLSSPLWGALFLWWFLGASLVALGLLNAVRAFTSKKD